MPDIDPRIKAIAVIVRATEVAAFALGEDGFPSELTAIVVGGALRELGVAPEEFVQAVDYLHSRDTADDDCADEEASDDG